MLLMVAGEVVAVRSATLWVLLPLTMAYLELLVGPWEERHLARTFGEEYETYARTVWKWLPRRCRKPEGQARNRFVRSP